MGERDHRKRSKNRFWVGFPSIEMKSSEFARTRNRHRRSQPAGNFRACRAQISADSIERPNDLLAGGAIVFGARVIAAAIVMRRSR